MSLSSEIPTEVGPRQSSNDRPHAVETRHGEMVTITEGNWIRPTESEREGGFIGSYIITKPSSDGSFVVIETFRVQSNLIMTHTLETVDKTTRERTTSPEDPLLVLICQQVFIPEKTEGKKPYDTLTYIQANFKKPGPLVVRQKSHHRK